MELYISIFAAILAVIAFWLIHRKRMMSLFERYGIPGPKPNFWNGNLNEFIEKREGCTAEWTKKYGKFVGFYFGAKPMLIAYDLEFLRTIQIKEFQNFSNKDLVIPDGGFPHPSMLKFVEMLKNEEWKNVRSLLSFALSSGKIKKSFPIVSQAVGIFMENIKQQGDKTFDILNLFKKLTLDTTSKSFFGIATDVQNNNTNMFIKSIYDSFELDSSHFLATVSVCFPEFEPLPTKLRSVIDIYRYFTNKTSVRVIVNGCQKIIDSRKKSKTPPSDLLQSMIEATDNQESLEQNDGQSNTADKSISSNRIHKISDEEVLGNALGFMVAGYHTTSSTLGYCVYLLSKHPDVQDKARNEINKQFKSQEEIDFSGLSNLQYMDQVISETLRLFPLTLPVVNRVCKEDFKYKGMTIPKGAIVVVPVWTLHRDPEYWPEPEKFIPERFSPENRGNINQFFYQPFGTGPRICIGMRLATSIMKYTLANLLMKYRIENCYGEKEVEVEHTFFFIQAKDGIRVRVTPL